MLRSFLTILVLVGVAACSRNEPHDILDDEPGWSAPVNGLEGRLYFAPLKSEATHVSPYFELILELRSTEHTSVLLKVAYTPNAIVLKVTGPDGQPVERGLVGGNQVGSSVPPPPLNFPGKYWRDLSIGSVFRQGAGAYFGEYLENNFWNQWRIMKGGYRVGGTCTIPPAVSSASTPDKMWSGTLQLPSIEIPMLP